MSKPSDAPVAIITGRALLVWPTDAPKRIGSIGSVQGAAMVMTPASRARTRLSIRESPSEKPFAILYAASAAGVTPRGVTCP